jgi:methylglyoxal synthase
MAEFARRNRHFLARWKIVATGTTGGRVLDAVPELDVIRLKSGPLGGDQQIGALISTGEVGALIFFVDPLTPMPHDVDVKALMRLAIVYDIPMALNEATAEKLISTLHA